MPARKLFDAPVTTIKFVTETVAANGCITSAVLVRLAASQGLCYCRWFFHMGRVTAGACGPGLFLCQLFALQGLPLAAPQGPC